MNKREIFSGWLWMTLISLSSVFAQWNPAVNLGSTINTSTAEKASDISSDGLTLYFHHDVAGNMDIYYCTWNGSTWSAPINIGSAINSSWNDYGPSLSVAGQRLYFSSNRPGGYGSYDIYVSSKVSGVWQSAVNLGPVINSSNGELGQDISAGDSVLWFARGWPEPSPTNEDIYYSRKVNGVWTTPVQIGRAHV